MRDLKCIYDIAIHMKRYKCTPYVKQQIIDSSCFISYVINLCNKHQVLSKKNYPFFLFFVITILVMLLLYGKQLCITEQLLKWK